MYSEFMRRVYGVVLVLALAGSLPSLAPAAPRLLVEQPNWDFGSVTNTTRLEHDFVLRNAGDASLEIRKVVTSCDSCLTVVLDDVVIPAGGRTLAHCALDTRLLSGEVFRFITIQSNDPLPSEWSVELHASIVPVYAVNPVELTVGGAAGHRQSAVDVTPLLKLKEPLSEVECDNTNISVNVMEGAAGQYLVVAQALESLPRGRSRFSVVVRSQNSNDPPCRILGRLEYPEEYEVIPSQLTFEAKDEPQSRIVWLRQHGGPLLVLQDAVPSSGEFHCEIDPDPVSVDYRIYVDARNLSAARGQSRRLTLRGVTPQRQEVALTVGIVVQ